MVESRCEPTSLSQSLSQSGSMILVFTAVDLVISTEANDQSVSQSCPYQLSNINHDIQASSPSETNWHLLAQQYALTTMSMSTEQVTKYLFDLGFLLCRDMPCDPQASLHGQHVSHTPRGICICVGNVLVIAVAPNALPGLIATMKVTTQPLSESIP